MARDNAAESVGTGLNAQAMSLAPELVLLMKEEVSRTKEQNLPLNRAFEKIAKKSGLKFNTVRNYYYRYIHEKDEKKRSKNYFTSSKRKRRDQGVAGNSFKESEVKHLVVSMLRAQAQGESVRSCANRLANNDPKLMLRYQNKYRNIIANKQDYVKTIMEELDREGIEYYDPLRKVHVKGNGKGDDRDKSLFNVDQNKEMNMEAVDSSELLEVVGELVSHMREIDSYSLVHFFRGLRDMSRMAAQWKKQQSRAEEALDDLSDGASRYREMLTEKDYKIQELNAKILSYEARIEDYKNKVTRLMSMFRQLISINQNFLNLSSSGKLTGLQDYIKELESVIKGYDGQIAE